MNNVLVVLFIILSILCSSVATAQIKATQSSPPSSSAQQTKQKPKAHAVENVGVWLYSLDVALYQDLDDDGFHQNMRLNVDLDTNVDVRDVVMQVWLITPEGSSELVYETTPVTLVNESYDDALQIDIQFIDDYIEDYYDIELVIIDVATDLEVFHVDGFDDDDLQALAIEGQAYDQSQDISIYSADIDLYNDDNHNGYYHQLSVSFDVDVPYGRADLIAQFYIDDQLIYTSRRFSIFANSTSDEQTFDVEMISGLEAGYYDLDIHILDADELVQRHHIAAVDWVVFKDLPLESAYWDHVDDEVITVDVEQSGGNLGVAVIALLLLMGYRRKTLNVG